MRPTHTKDFVLRSGSRGPSYRLASNTLFRSIAARLKRSVELLKRIYHEFNDDDVMTYAAALAYHALLALFPFVLFLLALVTFFDVPVVFDQLIEWSRTVLPPAGLEVVSEAVESFRHSQNAGLLSAGILGAIWAASGGVRSAITALNKAYDVNEFRPTWRRYALSVAFTIGLGALVLVAMTLMMIGPRAAEWLAAQLHLSTAFSVLWTALRYPVAAALLMIVAAVVYSVLPNVRGFHFISVGAIFAVTLWIALSLAFQLYLDHFGNYDVFYGSIGAVIVLLLYLWLSALVLLLGGELNAVLAAESAAKAGRR